MLNWEVSESRVVEWEIRDRKHKKANKSLWELVENRNLRVILAPGGREVTYLYTHSRSYSTLPAYCVGGQRGFWWAEKAPRQRDASR